MNCLPWQSNLLYENWPLIRSGMGALKSISWIALDNLSENFDIS